MQRNTKEISTEIERDENTTVEISTEKLTGADKKLEILVGAKVRFSTVNPRDVVNLGFHDQFGYRPTAGYTEPFMEIS